MKNTLSFNDWNDWFVISTHFLCRYLIFIACELLIWLLPPTATDNNSIGLKSEIRNNYIFLPYNWIFIQSITIHLKLHMLILWWRDQFIFEGLLTYMISYRRTVVMPGLRSPGLIPGPSYSLVPKTMVWYVWVINIILLQRTPTPGWVWSHLENQVRNTNNYH